MPAGVPSFAAQPHTTYKLRNKILAGGRTIHFGNNVSEFKNRTRRVWRPNIIVKSLWSEALGRRVKLRMVVGVLRTIDKEGGLDAYLTCTTRRRMKELGPRGWEIRAAVIKALRAKENSKYVRLLQRTILLCPELRIDSEWKEIRSYIRHTEAYAVLPEQYCKAAFTSLMKRLRDGRPVVRKPVPVARSTFLKPGLDSKFVRRVRIMNLPRHIKKLRKPKATARLGDLSGGTSVVESSAVEKAVEPQTGTLDKAAVNLAKLSRTKGVIGKDKSSKVLAILRRRREVLKERRIAAAKKRKALLS